MPTNIEKYKAQAQQAIVAAGKTSDRSERMELFVQAQTLVGLANLEAMEEMNDEMHRLERAIKMLADR